MTLRQYLAGRKQCRKNARDMLKSKQPIDITTTPYGQQLAIEKANTATDKQAKVCERQARNEKLKTHLAKLKLCKRS